MNESVPSSQAAVAFNLPGERFESSLEMCPSLHIKDRPESDLSIASS